MARRTIHLHVDFAGLAGESITTTLLAHREQLRELGHKVPVKAVEEPWLATVEIRRTHRDHGLRRKEVEGAWAEICRRALKGRRSPLLSVPGFGRCSDDEVALLLDSLAGLRVHLVATVPTVASPESAAWLDHALGHWSTRLASGPVRGRTTTVPVAPGDWRHAWEEYAAAAGLDAAALPLVPTLAGVVA